MINTINSIISTGNTWLWSYILIILLITLGLYFTISLGFPQFRFFTEMFRLIASGRKTSEDKENAGISPFQAFCISVASHVGTGNLAGVAIAVSVGGPGAVFWMWLIALVGAGSSFVENTLAQVYKVKDVNGYRGGPAYYMEKALGMRGLGIVFSVIITITFGLIFNSVQANTITFALEGAFGFDRTAGGFILLILTALVIFGGVKRIARVAEILVPIMAIAYVLVALYVVIKNITEVPAVLNLIFSNAFGLKEVAGGGLGVAIMQGIKRGLFSNEAGMGSAPNAAATSTVSHPAKQGLIQVFGVFIDTLLICTSTAFVVLLSDMHQTEGLSGIQLTQAALSSQVGSWGSSFITLCIFLFAFSSILGNYYYGESNIEFLNGDKIWLTLFRCAVVLMVFAGSIASLSIVWDLADLFMGIMALINLIVIARLSKTAAKVLKDYIQQKKQGKDPVFNADTIEDLKNAECWSSNKIEA